MLCAPSPAAPTTTTTTKHHSAVTTTRTYRTSRGAVAAGPAKQAAPLRRLWRTRAAASGSGNNSGSSSGNSGSGIPIHDMGRPIFPERPPSPTRILDDFERATLDARPAAAFYATPRIGARHASDAFLARATDAYAEVLSGLLAARRADGESEGGGGGADDMTTTELEVLDLCSAAESHLPPPARLGAGARLRVAGHGINAEELAANPALRGSDAGDGSGNNDSGSGGNDSSGRWLVRDLDVDPSLAGLAPARGGGAFDAVLCCCGVYYLKRLEDVAAEVARVLRPGRGVFVAVFGDDCYQSRALAGFLARSLDERAELLTRVLLANGFAAARTVAHEPERFRAVIATAAPAGGRALYAEPPPLASQQQQQQQREPAIWAPALTDLLPGAAAGAAAGGGDQAMAALEWRAAYAALAAEAIELGVPESAIPRLPDGAAGFELEAIRAKQAHLQGIVASFLSAGL